MDAPRSLVPRLSRGEIGVLLVATAAALLPMLAIGFVNDDVAIVSHCFHNGRPDLAALLTRRAVADAYYRPLVDASFAIDYWVWGWNAFGFRLTNLLLHLANVLLVYGLGARLLRSRWQALVGAACFGVLPIHETSLYWVPGRTDLLCTAFYLGSIGCLALALDRPGRGALPLSLSLSVLALFSKEMAFSLPLMVLVLVWWHPKGGFGRGVRLGLLYFTIAVATILVRWMAFGNNLLGAQGLHGNAAPAHVLKNLASYAGLLIVPFGHYRIERFLSGHPALFPILALGGLGLAGAALASAGTRRRSLLLAALWVGITLLPVARLMYRWYLYLPSVGFAIGLGSVVGGWSEGKRGLARAATVALWLAYAGISATQALPWIGASRIYRSLLGEVESQATLGAGADTLTFVTVPGKIGTTPIFLLGLPAALRQSTGRDDMDAFTWAPVVMERFPARVSCRIDEGGRTIRVGVEGGSFTLLDADLISGRRAPLPGTWVQTGGARITIDGVDENRKPNRLSIALDRPIPRNTFLFDGAHFVRLR